MLFAAAAASTRQSRAWMSRLRRPVSDRSTTGSWKRTLLGRARGQRFARDVEAGHARASGGRRDRRGEHPDRRRLAGAVGAEQAEHLAGADLEVDALDGLDAARVGLGQPAHLDRRPLQPWDEFDLGLH